VTKGQPLGIRLLDMQVRFDEDKDRAFTRSLVRIDSPEALAGAGNVTFGWQPGMEKPIVHHVLIRRGTETIDVLKRGQAFTVLRREGNLESAMLDGRLTATLQVPDLRVGDTIELALSIEGRHAALGTYSERYFPLAGGLAADRLHIVHSWPASKNIRWKVGDGAPKAKLSEQAGRKRLVIDETSFSAAQLPEQVPGRFLDLYAIQASDFSNWSSISSLFAPVYEKATLLPGDSPVKAEAARIAASTNDPKLRAEAALKLVQSQVRYLYEGSGLGNYVPRNADEVWAARFGDCKGKSVLLLALLRELGVAAEPVLVSATRGNGVDEALPMPGRFDHILVKAAIGGANYWLDGTRLGDGALDRIAAPAFEWALPLRKEGAALERLAASDPVEPETETHLQFDAREGVNLPAKVRGEVLYRQETALQMAQMMRFLPAAKKQEFLESFWTERYEGFEIGETDYSFDELKQEARFTMSGTSPMDWDMWGTAGKRRFAAIGARLGQDLAPERKEGPYQKLPVAVEPDHSIERLTILLPNNGKGFYLEGEDFEQTTGLASYKRTASIKGDRFEMRAETRVRRGEISYDEAKKEDEKSDALFENQLFVRLPVDYKWTEAEKVLLSTAAKSTDAKPGQEAWNSAMLALQGNKRDQALTILDAAIAKENNASLLSLRAAVHQAAGNFDKADADAEAALVLEPQHLQALTFRSGTLLSKSRFDDALILIERMILIDPKYFPAYAMRASVRRQKDDLDGALSDLSVVLQLVPDEMNARIERVRIHTQRGNNDKALAEAEQLVKLLPNDATAHALHGNVLAAVNRGEDAKKALARSIEIEPRADAYMTLLRFNLSGSPEAALDDLVASLRLDPTRMPSVAKVKQLLTVEGAYKRILKAVDEGAAKFPTKEGVVRARAAIEAAAGNHAAYIALLDEELRKEPKSAQLLNNRCWYRATNNVELDRALEDCDASLAIERYPANLDSRGMVHLRRGDFDKAIGDYDAALKINTKLAPALYGRGLAKIAKGDRSGGGVDLAAARALRPSIEEEFAGYGLKP
jgi:tetratricopeptide (TPR) repeat protein